jgi:hypothetical protein
MVDDFRQTAKIFSIRSELAAFAFREAACRVQFLTKEGFNPLQPRVPAGNSDGGEWTDGTGGVAVPGGAKPLGADDRRPSANESTEDRFASGAGKDGWHEVSSRRRPDGSLESRTYAAADGATIVTEFAPANKFRGWTDRSTVTLATGETIVFENEGNIQTVRDDAGSLLGQTAWSTSGMVENHAQILAFNPGDSTRIRVPIAAVLLYALYCTTKMELLRLPYKALLCSPIEEPLRLFRE